MRTLRSLDRSRLMYNIGTFSILALRDPAAAAGLSLMIEAWAAVSCAGESCGPARLPQSRGAAVCELDEAALSEAAGGPAGCRMAAQPSALLGPMSTTVPRGAAAKRNSRSRGSQTGPARQRAWAGGYFLVACVALCLPGTVVGAGKTPAGRQRRPPRRSVKPEFCSAAAAARGTTRAARTLICAR